MSQDIEKYLQTALQKLERAYEEHMRTAVYSQESEKIRILIEMIKEQIPHEDTRSATR